MYLKLYLAVYGFGGPKRNAEQKVKICDFNIIMMSENSFTILFILYGWKKFGKTLI